MPDPTVPDTTSIRRSRVANIDLDRLTRRRAHLTHLLTVDTATIDTRVEFGARAAELVAIEVELVTRGHLAHSERLTTGRPG